MGKRYRDIQRGGELKTALDNKTAWDLNTNGARKTKRLTGGTGTKRNLKTVGILPFTLKSDNATMFLVKMSGKSFDTTDATAFGKTKADNYYDATPTGDGKFYDVPPSGFSAARMSTFHPTGTGNTVDYVQAKATKLYYPKRTGASFHYPIGRLKGTTSTADEKETKQAIKADLLTLLNATPGRSVTFKDEKAGGAR